MHIAIDARYIREKPSGIGTYVEALVDRLPAIAPDDRFVFWAHALARRPLSEAPNATDIVVRPGPNSPWPVWWPHRYMSFDGVDVFHSPHNLLPCGVPCASVVTMHDVMAIERPDLHLQGLERVVKQTYYPQAVWRALREATRLITPTHDVAKRIVNLCPAAEQRIRVVLEAADACFRPPDDPALVEARAVDLIGGAGPYFLVVGANSATKRHVDAVSAMTHVPAPWRLVLLQRQGADGRLARVARRAGLADRIVWLPRVSRDDVVVLMQAAGALVQPSLYEGFGLPLIEAMACGCSVIASDIPVFHEVTCGQALFSRPGDIGSLGAAMKELATSPARRTELSARGLERAARLSWERSVRETLEVYREAFGSSPNLSANAAAPARPQTD